MYITCDSKEDEEGSNVNRIFFFNEVRGAEIVEKKRNKNEGRIFLRRICTMIWKCISRKDNVGIQLKTCYITAIFFSSFI